MCSLRGSYPQFFRPQHLPPAATATPVGPTGLLLCCVSNIKAPNFPSTGFSLSLHDLPSVPSRKTERHLKLFLFCYPTSNPSASPVLSPVPKFQLIHLSHFSPFPLSPLRITFCHPVHGLVQ